MLPSSSSSQPDSDQGIGDLRHSWGRSRLLEDGQHADYALGSSALLRPASHQDVRTAQSHLTLLKSKMRQKQSLPISKGSEWGRSRQAVSPRRVPYPTNKADEYQRQVEQSAVMREVGRPHNIETEDLAAVPAGPASAPNCSWRGSRTPSGCGRDSPRGVMWDPPTLRGDSQSESGSNSSPSGRNYDYEERGAASQESPIGHSVGSTATFPRRYVGKSGKHPGAEEDFGTAENRPNNRRGPGDAVIQGYSSGRRGFADAPVEGYDGNRRRSLDADGYSRSKKGLNDDYQNGNGGLAHTGGYASSRTGPSDNEYESQMSLATGDSYPSTRRGANHDADGGSSLRRGIGDAEGYPNNRRPSSKAVASSGRRGFGETLGSSRARDDEESHSSRVRQVVQHQPEYSSRALAALNMNPEVDGYENPGGYAPGPIREAPRLSQSGSAGSTGGFPGGNGGKAALSSGGGLGMGMVPERADTGPLVPCELCGRSFNPESIDKHRKICKKVFQTKRKTFQTTAKRLGDLYDPHDLAANVRNIEKEQAKAKSAPSKDKKGKGGMPKWKQQSLAFRAAILEAKGAAGDEDAQVQAQAMQHELQTAQVASGGDPDMVKCQHCGRTFRKEAAERHIPICQKTFGTKPGGGRLIKGGGRVAAVGPPPGSLKGSMSNSAQAQRGHAGSPAGGVDVPHSSKNSARLSTTPSNAAGNSASRLPSSSNRRPSLTREKTAPGAGHSRVMRPQ